MSTLFQPNFVVFGIDLSGGGCWELPMSNQYSQKLIFSGANRVSAAFQLRFSYGSAQLRGGLFGTFFGPEISAFLKVKLLVIFLCFSCVSAGKNNANI